MNGYRLIVSVEVVLVIACLMLLCISVFVAIHGELRLLMLDVFATVFMGALVLIVESIRLLYKKIEDESQQMKNMIQDHK